MSYVYGKGTNNQRAKQPVIVNSSKYILSTSKQSPSRRQGKIKTSTSTKLSPLTVIDPISVRNSSHHNHHHNNKKDVIGVDSPNNSLQSKSNSSTKVNGHHRNGFYYPYPYNYNDRNYRHTRTKSVTRNGGLTDEDVNRVYIEDNSLNSSLLSSSTPNEKKISDRGSSAETDSDPANHHHHHHNNLTDHNGKNISIIDGNMFNHHKYKLSNGHNSKKKKKIKPNSKRLKKSAKQWQTFIMRRTLLIVNIITLLLGVLSLIMAGIVDPQPLHRIGTTGAQISIASIYVIFVSLVGVYGARLKNYHLLFIYAYCLIAELVIRSLIALICVFFYHTGSRYFYSMISVIPEVALIFLSLAVALDIKQEEHIKALDSHKKTIPV